MKATLKARSNGLSMQSVTGLFGPPVASREFSNGNRLLMFWFKRDPDSYLVLEYLKSGQFFRERNPDLFLPSNQTGSVAFFNALGPTVNPSIEATYLRADGSIDGEAVFRKHPHLRT
jgi:hypothetical protein